MKRDIQFWKKHTHLKPIQTAIMLGAGLAQVLLFHYLISHTHASQQAILIRSILVILLPFIASFAASQLASYNTKQIQLALLDTFAHTPSNELEQIHPHIFSKTLIIDIDHLFQFWKEIFLSICFNAPILLYLVLTLLSHEHYAELFWIGLGVTTLFGVAFMINQRVKKRQFQHTRIFHTLLDQLHNYLDNVLQFRLYHGERTYLTTLRQHLTQFNLLTAQLHQFRQLYSTAVATTLLAAMWGGLWLIQQKSTVSTADLALATLLLLEVKRISTELLLLLQISPKAQESAERLIPWLLPVPTEPLRAPMPQVPLHTQSLDFQYKPTNHIIQYPAFSLQVGDRVWLQGQNGRGKSTLWKILTGLYANASTTIWLNETPQLSDGINPFWSQAAAVTEPPRCFSGTLWEIIGNFSASREEVLRWLTERQLMPFVETYPQQVDTYYDSVIRNLSAGQLKWLLLLQAFFLKPQLLILDEPFSSLDTHRQQATLSLIKQLDPQTTLLVISHHQIPIAFTKTIQL